MSSNSNQFQSPFLLTSRTFPVEPSELEPVLSKAYTDTANVVNIKTNGIYDKIQIVSGNNYYSTSTPDQLAKRRQSYRQIYTFGAIAQGATLTIPHTITGIVQVVNLYGNCIAETTVDTNAKYRPIPYVSVVNVNRQIQLFMNDTIITIINGAGADNILSGTIVVEYLLN